MDLNRSVRLLENALSPQGKSLLRIGTPRRTKDNRKSFAADPGIDLSLTMSPGEMRQMLEGEISVVDNTLLHVLQNSTITGSVIVTNKPWDRAIDSLFMEYLEVIQSRTNVHEIFETVSDLARCCTDTLNVVKGLKSKVRSGRGEKWLENERNTWRLIYCLYQDRLNNELREDNIPYLGLSEKLCIEDLYKRDSLVRESQLIIDWLECNANDEECNEPKVQHFTDESVGWENTLHQLQACESIVFKSTRPIISKMDPDAPNRERLPLHDLDMQDEERLCKKIFRIIRCGKLEEAQQICKHCGQPWRAAMLEGWRLFHDELQHRFSLKQKQENEDMETSNNEPEPDDPSQITLEQSEKKRREEQRVMMEKKLREADIYDRENKNEELIEGNKNRDVWKNFAWKYCHEKCINVYDRATIGAFCGCLQSLLPVCTTWEDQLWAYMKVMIDIRVESEIRDFVPRVYAPLPNEYWNNKLSLEEIFDKISSASDSYIRDEGNCPEHLIQKFLILDQIPQLMLKIDSWLGTNIISPHFLRFLTHLILFLKQIGHSQRDDIGDKVLEAYVKCLIERNEPQLVAYYTATLGQHQQVKYYSSFLEKISDNKERQQALQYGEEAGLNIRVITKQVVENIRNKPEDFEDYTRSLQQTITEKDKIKISAIDWLLFYPAQSAEAITQCNALIAYFLTLGKIDAAKEAFAKIPISTLDTLLSVPDEEISESVQKCLREHLCYKAYLEAHESFNDWFKYFHHSKPGSPPPLSESATFTEKVAHEHRVSQHKAETERWKLTVSHLAKTTKAKLYNVILFPEGGWLNGSDNPSHLRQTCIPEIVLLLYVVLSEMGDHTECIQLADILASKTHKLYKVYRKDNLEDILKKCFESSIVLLDEKKDMWGNYVQS